MNLYGAISFDSAATRVAIIDVDGTNTAVGVIDDPGREFLHAKFPTRPGESAAEFVTRLAGVMHELVGKLASGATRRVIGIASPAANGLRGTIESPANLGWGTVNIMELVRQHFTLPVAVSNDADARSDTGNVVAQHETGVSSTSTS